MQNFTPLYVNHLARHWVSRTTVGIHERIISGIAEEISKTIPCHIEGPPNPENGWAHVHIDGLGNSSVTITAYQDVLILAIFNNSLSFRKMRTDDPYDACTQRFKKEMSETDSVEWIIKLALQEIIDSLSGMNHTTAREIRIELLRRYSRLAPNSVLLGKPYYLI